MLGSVSGAATLSVPASRASARRHSFNASTSTENFFTAPAAAPPGLVSPVLLNAFATTDDADLLKGAGMGTPLVSSETGNARRCHAIAKEMLQVQQSYLKTLESIETGLRQPIIDGGVLSADDLNNLFPQFSQIIELHRELVQQLEARLKSWSDDSTIADIWIEALAKFAYLYPTYASKYQHHLSTEYLPKLAGKNKKLSSILKKYQLTTGLDKLSVNTHLGQPVQQAPRYVLLLKDMLKATAESHPSYHLLVQAVNNYTDLAADINAAVQADQNLRLMSEFRSRGVGFGELPSCTLLWAEPCTVVGRPTYSLLCLTDRSIFFTSRVKKEKHDLRFTTKHGKDDKNQKFEICFDLLHTWAVLFHDQGTTDRFSLITPNDTFLVSPKGSKDAATITRCVDVIHSQMRKYFAEKGFASMLPPVVSPADPLLGRRFSWTFLNGEQYSGWWEDGHPQGDGCYVDQSQNKYVGEFSNGKRQGNGRYNFATGGYYEGAWNRGKPHGQGKMVSAWGDVYVGDFFDGERHGEGKMTWPNGDWYAGTWRSSHCHGKGVLQMADGYVYSGEFEYSQPHGQGTLKWRNNCYEGSWSGGVRQGHGTLTFANGDVYTGSFTGDSMSGKGKYTRSGGKWSYEGTFVDGNMVGRGIIRLEGAFVYEGPISYGQRSGKNGVCTFADGSKYVGDWESDIYHGHGKLELSSGESYEGGWNRGLRDGEGTEVRPDGSTYVGTWSNDRPHGSGSLTDAAGNTYKGDFAHGRRNGNGTFYTQDGLYFYRGAWSDDKKHGEGNEIDRNWGTYTGQFDHGFRHGLGKFVSSDKSFTVEGPWRMGYFAGPISLTLASGATSSMSFDFDQATNKTKPNFELMNFQSPSPHAFWKR